MSIVVKNAKELSKTKNQLEELFHKLWCARTAEDVQNVSTQLQQYITEQEALRKAESEKINKETVTFKEWFKKAVKHTKMIEASNLLNKNAWKIKALVLIPAYGDDPETEWTGLVQFIDHRTPDFTPEFRFDADDYRTIIKKTALMAEMLDLGE